MCNGLSVGAVETMRRAIHRAIFLCCGLLILISCSSQKTPEIDKVIFGRQALAVSLNNKTPVETVRVFEGEKEIGSSVAAPSLGSIVDFPWQPGNSYRLLITPQGRTSPLETLRTAPASPEPLRTGSMELVEEIVPWQLSDSRYLGGRTAISADGRIGAVGTENSWLYVFDAATAATLWKKKLGEGRLLCISFTPSGEYLLVGEQSRDSFLYCFEAATGRLVWRFRGADVVGESESGSGRHPVIADVVFAKNDPSRCYLTTKRQYWKGGDYFYIGRVVCLDLSTGRTIWQYPKDENMDAGPSRMAIDADQRFVVFSNYKRAPVHDRAIYCLDAVTGELLWDWGFEPGFPGDKQLIWRGMDISADGRLVGVFAQNGRGFLLENRAALSPPEKKPRLLWQERITRPLRVDNLDLYGSGALARFQGHTLLLASGSTHAVMNKQAANTIEHPQANTLFAYSEQGELLWLHKIGGMAYNIELSADERYLLMPVRSSRSQIDTLQQGVYLFDLTRPGGGDAKLLWHHNTPGICLDGSLSADGRRMVALEYPLDMDGRADFQDIHGTHQIHCLR